MLRQRIVTALILALVFVGTVLFGDARWVAGLLALVVLAATRELIALTLRASLIPALAGGALCAGLFWWSISWMTDILVYRQALAGIALWLLIGASLPFYRYHGNWPLSARILQLGIGLGLLWICGHSLVYLHRVHGGWMLLFLFTLVWIADIGAYFSGRRFGRRKLAPRISPGKTWEGVAGGFAANGVWIGVVFFAAGSGGLGLDALLLIGLATVAISVVGDLFESVLKREAGVKDSGTLLPGHGGVLDRIDSLTAAAPVFVGGLMLASPL